GIQTLGTHARSQGHRPTSGTKREPRSKPNGESWSTSPRRRVRNATEPSGPPEPETQGRRKPSPGDCLTDHLSGELLSTSRPFVNGVRRRRLRRRAQSIKGLTPSNGDYGRIREADYRRMAGRRPGRSLALSSDVPAGQLSQQMMSDGAGQTQPRSRLLALPPSDIRNPRRRPSLIVFQHGDNQIAR